MSKTNLFSNNPSFHICVYMHIYHKYGCLKINRKKQLRKRRENVYFSDFKEKMKLKLQSSKPSEKLIALNYHLDLIKKDEIKARNYWKRKFTFCLYNIEEIGYYLEQKGYFKYFSH